MKHAHYIAITGIIIKDGKYLITKRSENEKRWPGKWTVPGGKLEVNDYANQPHDTNEGQWYNIFEKLIRREVQEETGLDIKNIRYLTSLAFMREDNIPTIVVSLFADHADGEVTLNDESIDHAWITFEEAKDYDFIAGIYEELEMLDKYLKEGELNEWKNK